MGKNEGRYKKVTKLLSKHKETASFEINFDGKTTRFRHIRMIKQ